MYINVLIPKKKKLRTVCSSDYRNRTYELSDRERRRSSAYHWGGDTPLLTLRVGSLNWNPLSTQGVSRHVHAELVALI